MLVPAKKKKERAMIRRAGAPMARASGLARKAERSRGEASRESSRAPDRGEDGGELLAKTDRG